MARLLIALLLCTAPVFVSAQEKRTDGSKLKAPGYTNKQIHGFTVMISDETIKQNEVSTLERKPLEVVELELKTVSEVCPAKMLTFLRKVPVWVEWNEIVSFNNGREGTAVAIYYGGHQANLLQAGMNAQKAKSVTILRLSKISELRQPKSDIGQCALLHEMSHAVHVEILGTDHAGIRAAYKQALERKLVDQAAYAATNEMEFFAEMTCAYFEQLLYFPRTRAELKKHDPVTFKLMEGIWGKGPVATNPSPVSKPVTSAPALSKAPFGTLLQGPPVTAASLTGVPVLLFYWTAAVPTSMVAMPKIMALDAEMADLGLRTVAIHLTPATRPDVMGVAKSRQLRLPLYEAPARAGEVVDTPKDFPVALVYDHDANCIYKGSALDAETPARQAVAAYLISKSFVDKPKGDLAPVFEALRSGKPAMPLLTKLKALTRSNDSDVKEQAQSLLDVIAEGPRRSLEQATGMAESSPLEAFLKVERLAATWKDTPPGPEASALLAKLKQNKTVSAELKARPDLAKVKKIDADLMTRTGSFNPDTPDFQTKNAATLKQLGDVIQQMKKAHPNAKATEEALEIAARYGISIR
jgi:hypothetical protein